MGPAPCSSRSTDRPGRSTREKLFTTARHPCSPGSCHPWRPRRTLSTMKRKERPALSEARSASGRLPASNGRRAAPTAPPRAVAGGEYNSTSGALGQPVAWAGTGPRATGRGRSPVLQPRGPVVLHAFRQRGPVPFRMSVRVDDIRGSDESMAGGATTENGNQVRQPGQVRAVRPPARPARPPMVPRPAPPVVSAAAPGCTVSWP
jgi:hypothetical protein